MKGHETANGVGPIDAVDEFYFNIHYHPKMLPLGTATPNEKNLVRINNIWTRDGYLAKGKARHYSGNCSSRWRSRGWFYRRTPPSQLGYRWI